MAFIQVFLLCVRVAALFLNSDVQSCTFLELASLVRLAADELGTVLPYQKPQDTVPKKMYIGTVSWGTCGNGFQWVVSAKSTFAASRISTPLLQCASAHMQCVLLQEICKTVVQPGTEYPVVRRCVFCPTLRCDASAGAEGRRGGGAHV